MPVRHVRICFLLLALFVLSSLPTAAADGVFTPTAAPLNIPRVPCRSTIPRSDFVTLDLSQLNARTLSLNLFEDTTYNAVQTRIEPRPLGRPGYIWYGRLEGVETSIVVLVVDTQKNIVNGRISVPGWRFAISPVLGADGLHEIRQIELGANGDLHLAASDGLIALPSSLDSRVDDGSMIDIMVVYTPAAVSILERVVGDVDTAIEAAIAFTNTVLDDSGTITELNLVHSQWIFYLEQPNVDFDEDLNMLMGKTDGKMDEVHALRDLYAADLVAMIAGTWFASYRGNAPAPSPLTEDRGFSITEACNIQDETFTQMIGYNLGSSTDEANTPVGEPPVNSFGYGYQDPSTGGGDYGDFVTVMASRTGDNCPPIVTANQCSVLERFSNPDQTFGGKPSGATDADNAASINDLAVVVANYRDSAAASTPTPTNTPGGPTETATPTTFPEITPTMTETPAAVQLLFNGGFEIDADKDKLPDFWSGKGFGEGDGVVCGGTVAASGNCAFELTGAANESSKITQKFDGAGLIAGTELKLSGQIAAEDASSGASLRLTIKYTDGTKDKLALDAPVGTYSYAPLAGFNTLDLTVSKVKVQVRFKNSAASGKYRFDDVQVTANASASLLSRGDVIPVPAAP